MKNNVLAIKELKHSENYNLIKEEISGIWLNDKWIFSQQEFVDIFNDQPINTNTLIFHRFNGIINYEVKYFVKYKLLNKHWKLKYIGNQMIKVFDGIAEFLELNYPMLYSLSELKYDKVRLQLNTYLEEKDFKRSINQKMNSIFRMICEFFVEFYDVREEYEKDIWDIRKINPSKLNPHIAKYRLRFTKTPQQYKDLLKRYIKMHLNRYSYGSAYTTISELNRFLNHIFKRYPEWTDLCLVSRNDIEVFISFLNTDRPSSSSKTMTLYALKKFLEYIQYAEYPEAPVKPVTSLIYREDMPKETPEDKKKVKYIPINVLAQLEEHLHNINPEYLPIVILLRATGWRVSDILGLRYDDCLDKTENGWYLVGDIKKTNILSHRVPITEEVAKVVVAQVDYIKEFDHVNPNKYLFVTDSGTRKGLPPLSRSVATALNKLAYDYQIKDDNGNIFRFKNHAFRHTKGVELINNGMNILHVQKWMAHVSPKMTMRYARILDSTLRKSWESVMKKGIFKVDTSTGKLKKIDIEDIENNDLIEWEYIRQNLDAVRIPLGFCMKPKKIPCNHQLNPCLTCNNMCTSPEFLNEFEQEIDETKKQIERAKTLGREMWVEKNSAVLERLQTITDTLRQGKVYHKAGKHKREYIGEERYNG
jgi:integrase